MHLLCLHGLGTNSKVLEVQTAAIRAELGGGHTYDFVNGTVPWPKAPELGDMFLDEDQYFAYYDPENPLSMYKAILDLKRYIEVEGPFDGVLGFSHGAALASSYLLGQVVLADSEKLKSESPWKYAIFLSGGVPCDLTFLRKGELVPVTKTSKLQIGIPTAHIFAKNDVWYEIGSSVIESLSISQVRHISIHNEGHVIPSRRSPEALCSAANAIRRTIWEVVGSS
ncbi:hypothetical protein AA313_de0204024 [Arthrobotrys entomopaga]|nr:hypothetical protein AA313_de0204024 [Arthrobotrys entomopaga]